MHDYLHLDNVGNVKGQNMEVQIYFLRVEDVLLYYDSTNMFETIVGYRGKGRNS